MQTRSEVQALGQSLAFELRAYARRTDVAVLALSTAVVPLAADVAQTLQAPLDLFLVRPLTLSGTGRPEIGLVASGGVLVLDSAAVKARAISAASIASLAQDGARELARLEQAYRGGQEPLDVRLQKTIVIDDGRTGLSTLRMTVTALRRRWVERVVLAAPTMPISVCRELLDEADEIVAALTEESADTGQATEGDEMAVSATEVAQLLRRTAAPLSSAG